MLSNTLILLLFMSAGSIGAQDASRADVASARKSVPGQNGPDDDDQSSLLELAGIGITNASFNPTLQQSATIRFTLSRKAVVTVTVYGPNGETIIELLANAPMESGLNQLIWDGRDGDGVVVPDEAYFLLIDAVVSGQSVTYNPLIHSGGERIVAAELAAIHGRRLTYTLAKPCRVLARAAVKAGPLLRTMTNWRPRPAGLCLEQWDGKDADGLRKLEDVKNLRFAVMAYTLPDHSIITTGNEKLTYRDYYLAVGKNRPHIDPPNRMRAPRTVLSPYWGIAPHLNRDPVLAMTLVGKDQPPKAKGEVVAATDRAKPVTVTSETLLVRIDIPDPIERDFMNNQRFEVIIYVDDQRVMEVEQGHVPFSYPWDVSKLNAGTHIITINVASFRNHVGTVSRLVEIKK